MPGPAQSVRIVQACRTLKVLLALAGLCLQAPLGEAEQYEVRCTVVLQTRPDRLYCYATNKPFRVVLKEPAEFPHGAELIATSSELVTNMVEDIPTLTDATVRLLGTTRLPVPLRVTPKELIEKNLNFYRVALRGRVLSHEWMYFMNRHIEVVVVQGADRSFRVDVLREFSHARERFPVGTEIEVVGLSFLEVFAEPRGLEVQVDVENLDECRIIRPAPWLTLDVARRMVLAGGVVVVMGLLWFFRERRQIARLRKAESVTSSINYFASSLIEQNSEDEILWDLAQKCVARLGFLDCVIYLLDPAKKVLVQKAAYGPKNPSDRSILNPITIPLGSGIVGSVALSGQAEIIEDTSWDRRYIVDDEVRLSEITVPIVANGEVLGVIDSEHPAPRFFTNEHLEILTSIASLCANKLVRVRAERKLRELNQDLEHRVEERTRELATANTQLQQAKKELLHSLAHEKELSELKSRFVSMVSHEFRTPLAIIMSSAEILEAYLDRLPPEERAANLKDIFEATKHMGAMVEEVLLLSRVEAGKLSCKPAPFDVTALCERLVDEIKSAKGDRCPVQFSVLSPLPEARGDEALLRHIFVNLLDNAVKYSLPGARVEFTLQAHDGCAIFTVKDRGMGIPEADARQLFQAFHRGQNVGDRPGSGLGLVIVKSCVELHGGKIHFESREGRGATFTVSLPLFGRTSNTLTAQNLIVSETTA